MKPLRASPPRGFTLVEIVVSMAVLSLTMLATVTALRTLGNTQVSIDRLTARVDELRTVSGFLRDTLESTVAGKSSGGLTLGSRGGTGSVYFEVAGQALEWKAAVLFGEGYGGSHFLRVAQEGEDLVLRWQESGAKSQPENWELSPSRILIHDLEELDIAYRREYGGIWLRDWDRRGLPVSVKVQLKAAGRYWPDLIFPVQQ